MLTIVPTPIGNLKDITLRALEALHQSDTIICEDTRRTNLLLNHYQIRKPLIVLNDFNESRMVEQIISILRTGQNLCLVSDAGTPLISDPGYKIIRECLKHNLPVDSLPGPTAAITALTLSALPPNKFLFLGFLPEKIGQLNKLLQSLQTIFSTFPTTFIAYVSPYKLVKTVEQMHQIFGNQPITLARELTKIHQQVESKPLLDWLEEFKKRTPKGEYVLLFNLERN